MTKPAADSTQPASQQPLAKPAPLTAKGLASDLLIGKRGKSAGTGIKNRGERLLGDGISAFGFAALIACGLTAAGLITGGFTVATLLYAGLGLLALGRTFVAFGNRDGGPIDWAIRLAIGDMTEKRYKTHAGDTGVLRAASWLFGYLPAIGFALTSLVGMAAAAAGMPLGFAVPSLWTAFGFYITGRLIRLVPDEIAPVVAKDKGARRGDAWDDKLSMTVGLGL